RLGIGGEDQRDRGGGAEMTRGGHLRSGEAVDQRRLAGAGRSDQGNQEGSVRVLQSGKEVGADGGGKPVAEGHLHPEMSTPAEIETLQSRRQTGEIVGQSVRIPDSYHTLIVPSDRCSPADIPIAISRSSRPRGVRTRRAPGRCPL